jgi:hypothetical protein
MKHARNLVVAVTLLTCAPASGGIGQAVPPAGQRPVAATDDRLAALPPALREQGRRLLAEADEDKRADLAEELAETDALGALDFLLALLETDPSADVRENIVDELEDVSDPRVGPALEKRVLADPDLDIVLASLDLLRARAEAPLLRLVEQRLAGERKTGTAETIGRLVREQERWTTIVRGGLLPTFLQTPPPVFAVAPPQQPVRVLAFGDFGDGSKAQQLVATAMLRYHREHPFNFAVTLGDNFYPRGMESPDDPRWKTWWSTLYDPLKIPFYATLGNHDWNQPNSPAAEILFTRESTSWRMPATYYTFTAGPVQFFALDTDVISEAQLLWLTAELDRSRATWKVVYGHHPIYSAGQHEDNNVKIEQLLPVLKDRANVYLAGHDHDMQHLKPEGGLHFFIAGTGGKLRTIEPGPRSLFARGANGFAVIEADAQTFTVRFIEADLSSPYSYTLRRAGSGTGRGIQ